MTEIALAGGVRRAFTAMCARAAKRGIEAGLVTNNPVRAAADFLQAADQELKIDYRPDHSQKTRSIIHRIADEKDSARGVSFADDQGLAVIGAAIAGGCKSSFQFAVQEGVRSDASRRNAFGVGVQQGRVRDFVGRRYEIFQQSAKFRRLNIGFTNVAAAGYLDGGREVGQHHVQGTFVLGKIIAVTTVNRIPYGLKIGFAIWLGFVMTVQLIDMLFGKKPTKLFLINTGYQLVCYLVMSVIFTVWPR